MRLRVVACLFLAFASPVAAQELRSWKSKAWNYRLEHPENWTAKPNGAPGFDLVLGSGTNVIMVQCTETTATPEDFAGDWSLNANARFESYEVILQRDRQVAGEVGIYVEASAKQKGREMLCLLTAITHQGLGYQFFGLFALGDPGRFRADYDDVLASVEFLKDRKDWLALNQGEPRERAILGGLAGFSLRHPRWRECTFDDEVNWNELDSASFALRSGGVWAGVSAVRRTGPPDLELARYARELAGMLADPTMTSGTTAVPSGPVTTVRLGGVWEERRWVTLVCVVISGDVVLRAQMNGAASREVEIRQDWEELVASLVMRPAAGDLPAWVPGAREWGGRPAVVEAIVAKSRLLAGPDKARSLVNLSPDARLALVREGATVTLESLATGKIEKLDPAPDGRAACWSPDGRLLGWTTRSTIEVLDTQLNVRRTFKGSAELLAFSAGSGDLFAAVMAVPARPYGVPYSAPLRRYSLLEDLEAGIVEGPLVRVAAVAQSPDGGRLAFASNVEHPRTQLLGSNIWVGGEFGQQPVRLTHGAEIITRLDWTPDGSAVLALRQLGSDREGKPRETGQRDVWRIPVDGSPPENLTRCGVVSGFWVAPTGIRLAITDWTLHPGVCGLFEIPWDDLAAAVAPFRPVPPADPAAAARLLRERLVPLFGGRSVFETVPTADLLARLADAFAAGLKESRGLELTLAPEELDRLDRAVESVDLEDPYVLAAAGAYYGELLRRGGGATWFLGEEPFGRWFRNDSQSSHPAVRAVHPWADLLALALGSESEYPLATSDLQGGLRRLVLVYPPAAEKEAVAAAAGPRMQEALALLDRGELRQALPLLTEEIRLQPCNQALVELTIAVCEEAGMESECRAVTAAAVEGGSRVGSILLRHAKAIKESDPAGALAAYKRAAEGEWQATEALILLGDMFAGRKQAAVAESCWRRAWRFADEGEKPAIQERMETTR